MSSVNICSTVFFLWCRFCWQFWNKFVYYSFHTQNVSNNCFAWHIWYTNFLSSFFYCDLMITEHDIVNFFYIFLNSCYGRMCSSLVIFIVFTALLETFLPLISPWFGHGVPPKTFSNISASSLHLILFLIQNLMQIVCAIISRIQKLLSSVLKCVVHVHLLTTNWASNIPQNWYICHREWY